MLSDLKQPEKMSAGSKDKKKAPTYHSLGETLRPGLVVLVFGSAIQKGEHILAELCLQSGEEGRHVGGDKGTER